jgi:hypothetical protein
MDLLYQIKARVVTLTVMENLPFLSKSGEQLPSRNVPPPPQAESDVPEFEEPRYPPMWPPPQPSRPVHQNPFDSLKENHIALILIGIVIGVLVVSMRPIVINPK